MSTTYAHLRHPSIRHRSCTVPLGDVACLDSLADQSVAIAEGEELEDGASKNEAATGAKRAMPITAGRSFGCLDQTRAVNRNISVAISTAELLPP